MKVLSLPIIPSDSKKQLHSSFPPKLEILIFQRITTIKNKINKYGFFKKADNKSSQRTIKRDVNANRLNDKNDNLKTSSKKILCNLNEVPKTMIPSDYDTSSQSQSQPSHQIVKFSKNKSVKKIKLQNSDDIKNRYKHQSKGKEKP